MVSMAIITPSTVWPPTSKTSVERLPAAAQATTETLLDTPNKIYIDAVYENLLGRAPDITGLDYWSGQLDQGGARATLINLIDHSAEYFGTIIKPAYLQYLGPLPMLPVSPIGPVRW